jgi:uncharacterized membrane protein
MRTQAKKGTGIKKAAIVAALMLLSAFAAAGCSGGATGGATQSDGAAEIKAGDTLTIEVADISDTARFYPIEIDGTAMEILAVKAPDGTVRTAFNTCEVCYDSGRGYYKQDGDALVCQNCGNRFKTSQVEVQSRGCNPWPIFAEDKTVTDETNTISYDFLSESTKVFANWKRSY